MDSHLLRIQVNRKHVLPYFLVHLIGSDLVRRKIISLSQGAIMSGLNSRIVRSIRFPLPPIPEQRQINEILFTVDDAIRKTDEVISKTEELKRGLMQRLLTRGIGHTRFKQTEIGEIPEEWKVARLGEIAARFISGGTPSTLNPEYWDGVIPWMRSAWITRRFVDSGERYISEKGLRNSASNIVPKGNILVATRVCIGNVAVNRVDIAISQDLTGVVIEKSKAYPEYVYWMLRNSENKLMQLVQGSTIKGVLRGDLENLRIPCPTVFEQQRIASILSTVDERTGEEKQKKEQFLVLKRGLMQVLLTGKVRVKLG